MGVPEAGLKGCGWVGYVGITASRTVNPVQLGSVAITDNQSWVFSRHCTGGKVVLRMANKLTDGGNGRVDKYGP